MYRLSQVKWSIFLSLGSNFESKGLILFLTPYPLPRPFSDESLIMEAVECANFADLSARHAVREKSKMHKFEKKMFDFVTLFFSLKLLALKLRPQQQTKQNVIFSKSKRSIEESMVKAAKKLKKFIKFLEHSCSFAYSHKRLSLLDYLEFLDWNASKVVFVTICITFVLCSSPLWTLWILIVKRFCCEDKRFQLSTAFFDAQCTQKLMTKATRGVKWPWLRVTNADFLLL